MLDLALAPERDLLRIAGEDYELRHPTEVGLRDFVRIQHQAREVEGLLAATETANLTDEQAEKLAQTLDDLVRFLIVEAPDDVHARLSDMARMQIVKAFTHSQLSYLAARGKAAEGGDAGA